MIFPEKTLLAAHSANNQLPLITHIHTHTHAHFLVADRASVLSKCHPLPGHIFRKVTLLPRPPESWSWLAYANQRKVSWGTSANKVNERSPYDSRFVRERGQPIVSASNSPLGCCVFRACDTYRPFCPLLLRRQRTWDEVSRPFPKTRVYFWIIRFSSLLLTCLTPCCLIFTFGLRYGWEGEQGWWKPTMF